MSPIKPVYTELAEVEPDQVSKREILLGIKDGTAGGPFFVVMLSMAKIYPLVPYTQFFCV